MAEVKTIDIQQAKARFEALVRDSSRNKAQWIVQEEGVPLAVIVSVDDFEDMLETVAELADPEYLASIQEARAQYRAGDVDTLQDLYDIAHGSE